jgi:predicted transposase YbfD/YdcC
METEKRIEITKYFEEVEAKEENKEYEGYFCSLAEVLTISILGTLCGLKNMKQIHQWSINERSKKLLKTHFGINHIPCYYWQLKLMQMIKVESLNECFINWVTSMLPADKKDITVSFDGKTIRSTSKLSGYEKPLHIVSAHIAQLGVTFGSLATEDKSNEIPTVRELIKLLDISGCLVVADALNCQKATAEAIIDAEADYLLNVKDNHETLKEDIEDYIQDDVLRNEMETTRTVEKNRGRFEERTAFVTNEIEWLYGKEDWKGITTIGAINRRVTDKSEETSESWHYFISSRDLSAEELLDHARLEWSVEVMHWLLDVHYTEDSCRIADKAGQKNLNKIRKIALNITRQYKTKIDSKRPMSNIMLDCLLEPEMILEVLTGAVF